MKPRRDDGAARTDAHSRSMAVDVDALREAVLDQEVGRYARIEATLPAALRGRLHQRIRAALLLEDLKALDPGKRP